MGQSAASALQQQSRRTVELAGAWVQMAELIGTPVPTKHLEPISVVALRDPKLSQATPKRV